ncbi:M91 family zinc metallopeptidase [Rubrivirga sp.]|uniref:M91 family zinc metallopeptidase n=1 Tax=Rubrivirga sp. TaxID=1885344 RepID=UPI003C77F3A8
MRFELALTSIHPSTMPKTIETPIASYPKIAVEKSDESPYFHLTVRDALTRINSKTAGKALLQTLNDANPAGGGTIARFNGHNVIIQRASTTKESVGEVGLSGGNKAVAISEEKSKIPGSGSKSVVFWHPNSYSVPGQGGRPIYIALAHELVHSMHYAEGTRKPTVMDEEHFTVGLDPYDGMPICENSIRAEHNVKRRMFY